MLKHGFAKLPLSVRDLMHAAGRLADERRVGLYVVGGFVRDLMLGVSNFDIDLVVEGDGIALAGELARLRHLKILTHPRFGTAVLGGASEFKVDIASARREVYEKPAALPCVTGGSIRDDLFRRDFTMNAMALSMNERSFGRLVDPSRGCEDLKKGLVRAHHVMSFHDDPTRILRAARFEQRFGFSIEPETLSWIKKAVSDRMLFCVHNHRLRDELVLIFKEKHPWKPLRRLGRLAGYEYISEDTRVDASYRGLCEKANENWSWFCQSFPHRRIPELYQIRMMLFFSGLSLAQMRRLTAAYAFHKTESAGFLDFAARARKTMGVLTRDRLRPSQVYRCLQPLSEETILAIRTLSSEKRLRDRIGEYFRFYEGQKSVLRGHDLSAMGLASGPEFKRVLDRLLEARLDGRVMTKEDEWEWARRLVATSRKSARHGKGD